jgi:hypothetical protein
MCARQLFRSGSGALCEAVLLQFVPVCRLLAAALVCTGTLETTSRAVSSLFMSRRIAVNENAFDFQVRELFVGALPSSITQGSSTLYFSHDVDHQRFKQVRRTGRRSTSMRSGPHRDVRRRHFIGSGGSMLGLRVLHADKSVTTR